MKLYTAIFGLLYFVYFAQALPTDFETRVVAKPVAPAPPKPQANPVANGKAPKEVPCDPVSKYSVNWFLANTCMKGGPKPSTCLFYTRGLSLKAKAYAKAHKPEMTTIWEMWDASLYRKHQHPLNPLRCIMRSDTDRLQYFRAMSTAMASLCDVSATVMDVSISPTAKTFKTVNQKGIWYSHEFPTLQKGAPGNKPSSPPGNLFGKKVDLIEAISVDGKTSFQYWVRPGVKVKNTRSEDVSKGNELEEAAVQARATCTKVTDAEIMQLDDMMW